MLISLGYFVAGRDEGLVVDSPLGVEGALSTAGAFDREASVLHGCHVLAVVVVQPFEPHNLSRNPSLEVGVAAQDLGRAVHASKPPASSISAVIVLLVKMTTGPAVGAVGKRTPLVRQNALSRLLAAGQHVSELA